MEFPWFVIAYFVFGGAVVLGLIIDFIIDGIENNWTMD